MKRGTRLYCIKQSMFSWNGGGSLKVTETYHLMRLAEGGLYELFEFPGVGFPAWCFLQLSDLAVEDIEMMEKEIETLMQ
jgi:hypothetical protein